MAVEAYVGEFTCDTTGGGGTQAITGVGFAPTVLICFSTGLTSGNATGAHFNRVIGFAVSGDTERSQNAFIYHNGSKSTGTNSARAQSASFFRLAQNSSEAAGEEFDISSFDSDGFTLTKTTVGSARVVKYIALKGVDAGILNVSSRTTTGTQAYTGLGFEPSAVFAVSGAVPTATGDDTRAALMVYSYGFATGATDRWCVGSGSDNANPNDASRIFDTTALIHTVYQDASHLRVDLESFDSDGLTLDYEAVQGTARDITLLCLKGASFAVGSDTNPSTDQTQSVTTTGVSPAIVMIGSADSTTDASIVDGETRLSFGAGTSSTQRHCMWSGVQQASGINYNCSRAHSNVQVMENYGVAGTTPTNSRDADIDSLDSEGFTLDWDIHASGTAAAYYGYFVIGASTDVPRLALTGVGF